MRARMALLIEGTPLELREVLLRDKPPTMLALSPKGTVPVLQTAAGDVIEEEPGHHVLGDPRRESLVFSG